MCRLSIRLSRSPKQRDDEEGIARHEVNPLCFWNPIDFHPVVHECAGWVSYMIPVESRKILKKVLDLVAV